MKGLKHFCGISHQYIFNIYGVKPLKICLTAVLPNEPTQYHGVDVRQPDHARRPGLLVQERHGQEGAVLLPAQGRRGVARGGHLEEEGSQGEEEPGAGGAGLEGQGG